MINLKGKWIIGDVHGCLKTLLALIAKLPKGAQIVFVGDLIDRGPDSRGVIDLVREMGYDCVQGNHELMMTEAFEDLVEYNAPLIMSGWADNGGAVFLEEYRLPTQKLDLEALQTDYEWMLNLPTFFIESKITDDKGRKLLVTHSAGGDNIEAYIKASEIVEAGVNEIITEHEMIHYNHQISNIEMLTVWDRRVPKKIQTEFFNVFGHTPIDNFAYKGGIGGEDKVNGCLTDDLVVIDTEIGYANIDSGCVYPAKRYGKYRGSMTAIHFPTLEIIKQENIDYD